MMTLVLLCLPTFSGTVCQTVEMRLGVVQREPSTSTVSQRLLDICTLSALFIFAHPAQ